MNWYTSVLNYDMTNGRVDSMMNIQMNQFMTDSFARANLYNVPMFSFNNYSYATPSIGLGYLTDPAYAFGQWSYNNSLIGAPNLALGVSSNPWANYTGSFFGNAFQGFQGTQGSSSSSSSSSSTADAATRAKVAKLQSLLKQIADKNILGDEGTAELKETLKTYSRERDVNEQFRILKEAYDTIDKSIVKDFMTQVELSNKATDKLDVLLTAAGYEQETAIDNKIDDIISSFKNITDENATPESNDVITALTGKVESNGYQILDLVSSWKSSRVVADTGVDKNIMKFIVNNYNRTDLGSVPKNKIRDLGIKPLKDAIIEKATATVNAKIDGKFVLDAESRDKITTLKNAISANYANGEYNTLAENFDKLYATLRRAEALIVNAKVNSYYGFLEDEQVFNSDLFQKETEEDLDAEGMANVGDTVSQNTQASSSSSSQSTGNTRTASSFSAVTIPSSAATEEDKINHLVTIRLFNELTETQTNALKEALNGKYELGEGDKVYLVRNGSNDTQTVAVVKDGKIYRLPVTFDGTNFTVAADANFTTLTATTAQEITETYNKEQKVRVSTETLDALTTGSEPLLEKVSPDNINAQNVYIETTATNGEYKKVYGIDANGNIKEITNAYYDKNDNKLHRIDENKEAEVIDAKIDDIKSAVRKAKQHENQINTTKLNSTELNYVNECSGKIWSLLTGHTTKEGYEEVDKMLGHLEEEKPVTMMALAYVYQQTHGTGIFDQIMSEWHGGRQNMAQKIANKIIAFVDSNEWAWKGDKAKERTVNDAKEVLSNISYRTDGKKLDREVRKLIEIYQDVLPKVTRDEYYRPQVEA